MRGAEHLLEFGQAVFRLDWLIGVDVDGCSCDVSRLDGIGESILIDDAAAGTVHQPDTLLHRGEPGGVNHAQRLGSGWSVYGQEVALRDHLVDVAIELDTEFRCSFIGEERVVTHDLHLQTLSSLRD